MQKNREKKLTKSAARSIEVASLSAICFCKCAKFTEFKTYQWSTQTLYLLLVYHCVTLWIPYIQK